MGIVCELVYVFCLLFTLAAARVYIQPTESHVTVNRGEQIRLSCVVRFGGPDEVSALRWIRGPNDIRYSEVLQGIMRLMRYRKVYIGTVM